METYFLELMRQYGYVVLFFWSILEGESGLVMAGLFAHTGDMQLYAAIATAGFGAFVGDQIYFYLGRFKKDFVVRKLSAHKRKLAIAKLLLRKYGTVVIFFQRYLYGLRTIIPLSIGLAGYSPKIFALINFISAFCWSALIITPVWYYGEQILSLISYAKAHWYFVLPLIFVIVGTVFYLTRKRPL